MSGYIRLHRKIRKNPLFKQDRDAMFFFINLLLDSAWKDTVQDWRGKPVEIKRGQLMMSVREMSEAYGLSAQNVRTLTNKLKSHKMLKSNTPTNKAPSIITICNYSSYQSDQQSANEAANDDVTKRQQTKEEKEEIEKRKEVKKSPPPGHAEMAWEAYNRTAGACGLARANKLTKDRRRKLLIILKDYGLDGWLQALNNIERSEFLTGRNDRGWKASFDFLITASSFHKVHDGSYGNGRHRSAEPGQSVGLMDYVSSNPTLTNLLPAE